jgi:hypothetical protein
MQVWRCKCGKSRYYESGMAPRECQGCEECGTAYGGELLKPHDFEEYVDGPTSNPRRFMLCRRCHKMEKIKTSDKK